MQRNSNRVLVIHRDSRVLGLVQRVLVGHVEVDTATSMEEAMECMIHARYLAVICDFHEQFQEYGLAFQLLIKDRFPSVRCMSMQEHITPHLETLSRCRRPLWPVKAGIPASMLLQALVASADDPVVISPLAH